MNRISTMKTFKLLFLLLTFLSLSCSKENTITDETNETGENKHCFYTLPNLYINTAYSDVYMQFDEVPDPPHTINCNDYTGYLIDGNTKVSFTAIFYPAHYDSKNGNVPSKIEIKTEDGIGITYSNRSDNQLKEFYFFGTSGQIKPEKQNFYNKFFYLGNNKKFISKN